MRNDMASLNSRTIMDEERIASRDRGSALAEVLTNKTFGILKSYA
jgi:hypothetical protein